MTYTLAQAAAATGRNRSSILRAIKAGRLSAARDSASEEWRIEPAELHRLYPAMPAGDDAQGASGGNPVRPSGAQAAAQVEIRELRAQLGESRATVEDLRQRLDEERAERRQTADRLAAAQERIAALLTDQRPPPPAAPARRWLPWRR
jgi:hypothetical protein